MKYLESFLVYLEENAIYFVFLVGGAVFSFVTAVLRSVGHTRKHFIVRLSESLICSCVSTGIAICLVSLLGLPDIVAIPVGVFVGFFGTDLVRAFVVAFLNHQVEMHAGRSLSEYTVDEGPQQAKEQGKKHEQSK